METLPQVGTICGALLVSKNFVSIVSKPLFRDDNRWGTCPITGFRYFFRLSQEEKFRAKQNLSQTILRHDFSVKFL
jgi:hypothetical protein